MWDRKFQIFEVLSYSDTSDQIVEANSQHAMGPR